MAVASQAFRPLFLRGCQTMLILTQEVYFYKIFYTPPAELGGYMTSILIRVCG